VDYGGILVFNSEVN